MTSEFATRIQRVSDAAAPALHDTWTVVREIGIDYAPGAGRGDLRLECPVLVEPLGSGRYVIVDELGLEKNRTVRIECRTVVADERGRILLDSCALGMDDGFGCAMGDGRIALLRRSKWEVAILEVGGEVTGRIDLCAVSQRMPRVVSFTPRGTLLVAFVDAVREVDIAEFDAGGALLWYLPRDAAEIGCPSNVSLTAQGTVLVADDFLHRVVEIDRDGGIVWQYGERKHPASDERHLNAPKSVRPLPGGQRLIADAGNHRVLLVEGDRCLRRIEPGDADLRGPAFADLTADGGFLVCDAGNHRVVELDARDAVRRQWGTTLARRRAFSYPRSIEVRGDRILVADTSHDRLVAVDGAGEVAWELGAGEGLFWPRCARFTPSGSLVVADGRNSRIVEIDPSGGVRNELRALDHAEFTELSDPHDVRVLPDGHLLVADSGRDIVVEVEWSGRVRRLLGPGEPAGLDDPHSVQPLADGQLLICDSGNSRIVWADADGGIVRELVSLSSGERRSRLNRPRYAEVTDDATLLVVDSGNNRVLAADLEGELLWELSVVPGSPLPFLNQPRWAQLPSPDELVISDHSNHRVLRLRRRAAAEA